MRIEKIRELICREFELDSALLDDQENLLGNHIDSFGLVRLIHLLEEIVGEKISEEQLLSFLSEESISLKSICVLVNSLKPSV